MLPPTKKKELYIFEAKNNSMGTRGLSASIVYEYVCVRVHVVCLNQDISMWANAVGTDEWWHAHTNRFLPDMDQIFDSRPLVIFRCVGNQNTGSYSGLNKRNAREHRQYNAVCSFFSSFGLLPFSVVEPPPAQIRMPHAIERTSEYVRRTGQCGV